MGSFVGFLIVYILGGITFIPLILSLLFFQAYLTCPSPPQSTKPDEVNVDDIERPTDDQFSLKTGTDALAEKFQRTHESDVASGYFAVCREYVPGGVNGKPPERTTPAGEIVNAESPSVYQSMYWSIFDRRQSPILDLGKGSAKSIKKARNVFFIVLRHGHLMLYDDSEQIEVRYVISLAHHDVSIYGGGDPIPEGELWIKRNAICLSRKQESSLGLQGSQTATLPFYLFSENLSEKEDFYFAILQNLEKIPGSPNCPPTPQRYDVKHIITLVQRLHSSEEQLQTRWINCLVGRLFLALYKTPELETFISKKISKKISRVKKPNFITNIVLHKIDAGEGAPFITNPRLKDLTVNGDCCIEADVKYSGKFRVEIAATARIELGTRFKAREVNLILAVVLKKLDGHGLLRFKPPPSNRIWISFETMPNMEMAIEPIVSSRQITYGVILRAIESRIREVVAETIVQPFWDDIPFLDSSMQKYRGGIWQASPKSDSETTIQYEAGGRQEVPEYEPAESLKGLKNKDDRAISMPSLFDSPSPDLTFGKDSKSIASPLGDAVTSVSSSVDRSSRPDPPLVMRTQAFAHVADPVVTTDNVKVDHAIRDSKGCDKNATSTMMEISSRSQPNSPTKTPFGSPPNGVLCPRSQESKVASADIPSRPPSVGSSTVASVLPSLDSGGRSSSLPVTRDGSKQDAMSDTASGLSTPSSVISESRQSVVSIGSAAAAAAKKWGWSVLSRGEPASKGGVSSAMPDHPIGRGRPLPPPGTPLPPPEKFNFRSALISMPKRKPTPAPPLPDGRSKKEILADADNLLPSRTNFLLKDIGTNEDRIQDDILVIKAPPGSDPASPIPEDTNSAEHIQSHQSIEECQHTSNSMAGSIDDSLVPQDGSDSLSDSADSEANLSSWPPEEDHEARSETDHS